MGNQTSGSGSGGSDVTKLYSIDGTPLDVGEEYGGFVLFRGKRKRDNAPVLVFRCEKSKVTSSGICANALRQAKKLRHPLILTLLDGTETETDILMVTEDATPLACALSDVRSENQRAWGIRCIASVLSFLNEKCRLVHGNVTPWSIFVTSGGDWKLFGLELLDMESAASEGAGSGVIIPPLVRQAQWIPSSQYKSPERRKNDFRLMESGNLWSIDCWSLGCVILDVYEGRVKSGSTQARSDPRSDAERLLPKGLVSGATQLLAQDNRVRLAPSAFIKVEYFSDLFVRSMVFLEELQLKAPEKREGFFKSLITAAPSFPLGSLQFKVIPTISQAISFESRAVNAANMAAASGQPPPAPASVNVLLSMMDAVLACEQALKASSSDSKSITTYIDAAVSDLFACNDRIVRVGLLQRIEKIATCTSQEAINVGFDQICTGFSDATPVVRELTIKAMISLVPKLNDMNKNDKLMRFLAKLQSDPEHAIRTNCVVCLGLIAPQLSADARRKTLTASFARAMKDPFIHARVAGLRGLISAHKLMGLDAEALATKILPTVCPLLVDPAKEVRILAVDAVNALMKTLQEELRTAEATGERVSTAAQSSGTQAEKSSEGFLGMAVSFASSLATTKPTIPGPSTPSQPVAPKPVMTQAAKPSTVSAKWEDDEEDSTPNFMLKEPDPDDFFIDNQKSAGQHSKSTFPPASAPIQDIFANEDQTKLKPARIGKKNSAPKAPTPRDLLTDDDMDFLTQVPAKPAARSAPPPAPVPRPGPAKSTITADDTDFFASLMTQPPKKKS